MKLINVAIFVKSDSSQMHKRILNVTAYTFYLRRKFDDLHTTTQSPTPKKVEALAGLYVFK